MWRCALVCTGALILGASAYAAPVEYESTIAWWGRRGNATEGNPTAGFALPVLSGDRMVGALSLVCPRQSERGAFLQIPMTVYPGGALQGKQVATIIGVNSQTFVGFVDDNRFLVYLNAKAPPPMPGMQAGTSVRGALQEAKGVIQIRTNPAGPSGVTIKPTRTEQAVPGLVETLRAQGLQPTGLSDALKACDAFMRGGN